MKMMELKEEVDSTGDTTSYKDSSVKEGKTYTLKVNDTKRTVKWSTSNKNIATVTREGVVKCGTQTGTTTITVSSKCSSRPVKSDAGTGNVNGTSRSNLSAFLSVENLCAIAMVVRFLTKISIAS